MKKLALALLTGLFTVGSFSSTISGIVFDNYTERPLVGAQIIVKNTKTRNIAYTAVVDFAGEFTLDQVDQGKYVLEVINLGYFTTDFNNLVVRPNANYDFKLPLNKSFAVEVIETMTKY